MPQRVDQDWVVRTLSNGMERPPQKSSPDLLAWPGYELPWPRQSGFINRKQELDHLWKELHPQPGARSVCLISGMVGSGKTALALEFAYRYMSRYSRCTWLMAESDELIPHPRRSPQLIIVDSASDPDKWLELVPQHEASILITTRASHWNSLQLAGLDPSEATHWVLSALDELARPSMRECVAGLCERFSWLPFPLHVLRRIFLRGFRTPDEIAQRIEQLSPSKWLRQEILQDPSLSYRPLDQVLDELQVLG